MKQRITVESLERAIAMQNDTIIQMGAGLLDINSRNIALQKKVDELDTVQSKIVLTMITIAEALKANTANIKLIADLNS